MGGYEEILAMGTGGATAGILLASITGNDGLAFPLLVVGGVGGILLGTGLLELIIDGIARSI